MNSLLYGLSNRYCLYLQQYFDKEFRNKESIMLPNHRQLDPYEENEVKGTRMPDYSKLSKERDIYGELGWIQNFNVKCSKNNHKLYPTYREFFDGPKNYHTTFNNSTMTNNEFFRQNAPKKSVARVRKGSPGRMMNGSPNSSVGFQSTQGGKKRAHSVADQSSIMSGSRYDTPFLLQKEPGNKFKVVKEVETTMPGHHAEIPFLRSHIDPKEFSRTHANDFWAAGGFTGANSPKRALSQVKDRKKAISLKRKMRREIGWNNFVQPISTYNSKVHPSMRIVFEHI